MALSIAVFGITAPIAAIWGSRSAIPAPDAGDHLVRPWVTLSYEQNATFDAIVNASIDPAFEGKNWSLAPDVNVDNFNSAIVHSRFKNLTTLIDTVVPSCGNSQLDGPRVNVSAMNSMTWQNDVEHEGFAYHGPCEGWIGNSRVFKYDCCRRSFPGYPAKVPIDFSKCEGDCLLKFYWLTLDDPSWVVFKQCVPIVNLNATEKALNTVQNLYEEYKAGHNDSVYNLNQTYSNHDANFISTANRSTTHASVLASVHALNVSDLRGNITWEKGPTNSSANETDSPVLITPTILTSPDE